MRYFIANTKMNQTAGEAVDFARLLLNRGIKRSNDTIVLCPSFLSIPALSKLVKQTSLFFLGAQNTFWERSGNYTGEVSLAELKSFGVRFCIIGHSERREQLGETDEMVQKKMALALEMDIIPILCVGETAAERKQGRTQKKLTEQLTSGLARISLQKKIIIAYEPLWAISKKGKGQSIKPLLIEDEIKCIKRVVRNFKNVSLLYGGSVDHTSIGKILSVPGVDGVLVGNASLDVTEWIRLYEKGHSL